MNTSLYALRIRFRQLLLQVGPIRDKTQKPIHRQIARITSCNVYQNRKCWPLSNEKELICDSIS